MYKRIIGKILNRIKKPKQENLLEMLWPKTGNASGTSIVLNKNYRLRQYNDSDRDKYFKLLELSEMGQCPLEYWENYILPNGFFVIEHIDSGNIVGACFASHQSRERHKFAGNLGWLAVDPQHRGNKLGEILINAVVNRLQTAGYERIYLETHDFRLPALKIYLNTGWVPFFYTEGMVARWQEIYKKLNLKFDTTQFPEISAYS